MSNTTYKFVCLTCKQVHPMRITWNDDGTVTYSRCPTLEQLLGSLYDTPAEYREYQQKHAHCPDYLHPERYWNYERNAWGTSIAHTPVPMQGSCPTLEQPKP